MKEKRDEYAEDLDENQIRKIVDVENMFVEALRAVHRRGVRVHVDQKENAERNDACQLMQLSEKESVAEFYCH